MRHDYGFHLICNNGKGYLGSSLMTPIGDLVQGTLLGQAKLRTFLNITTGQVYHEGFQTRVVERGHDFGLGLSFNTGIGSTWRVTVDKRFSQKLVARPKDGATFPLIEEDGSETIYRYDAATDFFLAVDDERPDKPAMRYHAELNQWILAFPKTNYLEYYNEEGLRLRREDAQGHGIDYEYDKDHNLIKLVGESGHTYEITRALGRLIISEEGGRVLQDHQIITDGNQKGLVANTRLG